MIIGYEKFKQKFSELYPEYSSKEYIFSTVGTDNKYFCVLKKTNNEIKESYISNQNFAKYHGKNLILKLVCEINTLNKEINKFPIQSLVKNTHFYKTLENIYYSHKARLENFTGKICTWYDNGIMKISGNFFVEKKWILDNLV
jgi:hypothetical protein